FSLLRTSIKDCIVGIIITTQDRDIPPIRNKRTKQYSQVNIDPHTQGLAFANIFLYDTKRNILLYEINRSGCFPTQLTEFIYTRWGERENDVRFDLTFPAVYRANEYQRMLEMDYYKKIIVELYRPAELINCFEENIDSMANIIKQNIRAGQETNADILKIEQVALRKRINPMGLSRSFVKGLIDAVTLNIVDKGFRENIQTLKVEGYTSDPENRRRVKPIDILADTFNEHFKIRDIQLQSDVQQSERQEGIENLYSRLLPEFNRLKK
ncbi:MAG: hypothetical protein FWC10_09980, partial [Lentimicrobiaceae bacterium]|nr:hypothetical protein [Lentimicrobiaceae bacterium]